MRAGRLVGLLTGLQFMMAMVVQAASGQGSVIIQDQRSEEYRFRVLELAGGLSNPWALAFLPDGGLLVTERSGSLKFLGQDDSGRYQIRGIGGVPAVHVSGQGGLLDLALDPEFAQNNFVYFTFAKLGSGGAGTALARARLKDFALHDLTILWELKQKTESTVHYGSRIAFGPDGLLYFNVSDRGSMNRAQDPGDAAGSILRLTKTGAIPQLKPGVTIKGWLPELYTIGHRNIQGLVFDGFGRLWATEHGPRGGDELNLIEAGKNYGWPLVTKGVNYDGSIISSRQTMAGMADPVRWWTPSPAPSGLTWYPLEGPLKAWAGNLFSGNLAGMELKRLVVKDREVIHEEVLLKNQVGRIRDVRVGPDGLVYLLTDGNPGKLLRIEVLD